MFELQGDGSLLNLSGGSMMSSYEHSVRGPWRVRRHVRHVLGAAGSVVAGLILLAGVTPAVAQEAESSGDSGLDALQEVVVTAQFRETKLQETPIAITAITADSLAQRNIEDLSEIQYAAPNVSLDRTSSAFGPGISAFIRGVGQGDFNFNFEPGVGIYVDDVYHATLMGSLFELMDLERVEVLRGPQGTLFGKNNIGGAIRMISTKPKGDGSAYIEGTYGEYNRKDLRAMFDVSLIPDKLFMRVSGMAKRREGFVDRIDYACANPDLGASQGYLVNTSAPRVIRSQALEKNNCVVGTEGGEDIQGARAALRLVASDRLEVNFSVDFTEDNSEASPTILLSTDPYPSAGTATGAPHLFNDPNRIVAGNPAIGSMQQYFLDNYGVMFDDRFITGNSHSNYATFYDLNRDIQTPPMARMESYGAALNIDFELTDNILIRSITGYRGYSGDWSDDQEASPMPLAWVHQVVDHHALSEEIQIVGTSFNDTLDWATGVFYFDGFNLNRGHINVNNVFWDFGGLDFEQDDPSNVKSKAAFLHGVYHVTDKLSTTAGVRYSEEEKDYQFDHVWLPFLNLNDILRETSYDRWDWKVGADYKFTDSFMAYTQVATGFKGGGLNPRPFTTAQVTAFGPEQLRSYEIGFKSQWFNRRLTANVALFLSEYTDLQLSSATVDALGAPFVGPTNVGEEEIRGFEIELEAQPFEGLMLNASVGYTEAKYKDLGNAINCAALAPGTAVPLANCVPTGPYLSDDPGGPRWRGNLGAGYMIPLPSGGTIAPRLDANFRSAGLTGSSNDFYSDDDVPGYVLMNGRVTWTSADGGWSVAALGTNLLDKEYYVNYFNQRAFNQAHMVGQPARPREWAVQVRRTF